MFNAHPRRALTPLRVENEGIDVTDPTAPRLDARLGRGPVGPWLVVVIPEPGIGLNYYFMPPPPAGEAGRPGPPRGKGAD